MQFLVDLWLPIVLAAVAVFVVSSVVHMLLPIHKSDCKMLPGEVQILAAMRASGVKPGSYGFPGARSMKEMCTPEMKAKYDLGPVGLMHVKANGVPQIGTALLQWFIYTLVMGVVVAYLAHFTLPKGAGCSDVFRVTGTAAFLGYGMYAIQDSIWKGQSWSVSFKYVFDGLLYALATGAVFGALWPA